MLSPRLKTMVAVAVATGAVIGSASDAFAIRNRYTNQQAQGFLPYFFGEGGPYEDAAYGYDGDGPLYRRRGDDRLIMPYRARRPVYGYDQ